MYNGNRGQYFILGRYYVGVVEYKKVGSYRGEDSGAIYAEFGDEKVVESYDLNNCLSEKIGDRTIKEIIDFSMDNWPPYAGDFYSPECTGAILTFAREKMKKE